MSDEPLTEEDKNTLARMFIRNMADEYTDEVGGPIPPYIRDHCRKMIRIFRGEQTDER